MEKSGFYGYSTGCNMFPNSYTSSTNSSVTGYNSHASTDRYFSDYPTTYGANAGNLNASSGAGKGVLANSSSAGVGSCVNSGVLSSYVPQQQPQQKQLLLQQPPQQTQTNTSHQSQQQQSIVQQPMNNNHALSSTGSPSNQSHANYPTDYATNKTKDLMLLPMTAPQQQQQQIVPNGAHRARGEGGGNGPRFVDITQYLNLPQNLAAQKLNIPTSTLSKRWKAAVSSNRKWPFRVVSKLDKEITTLLYNMPKDVNEQDMTYEAKVLKQKLGVLMQERQDHLKPVVILLP